MNKTRQDAWTKDEDLLLAEIVLRHIRNGKTQLEAFKQAGEALSRTSAACGFRWNATIRKQYVDAINLAKEKRKETFSTQVLAGENIEQGHSIESAIHILEKIKSNVVRHESESNIEQQKLILQLQKENSSLENKLKRYDEAWGEMKRLWEWIENKK